MYLIRTITDRDLPRLMDLARQASYGLTTLPPEEAVLAKRLRDARRAVTSDRDEPHGAAWLFALEDPVDGLVHGVSGIVDKVGGYDPFWSYRLTTVHRESPRLGISRDLDILQLEQEHDGPSEVGSLFLAPGFRSRGVGRALSLVRFVHIANHPQRFEAQIIAEMRGIVDERGRAPFWEAVGRHFFQMDFPEADYLSLSDKSFIADLVPQHPLYVCLLPRDAQQVIGRVHPHTRPAFELLSQEGFTPTGHVDVFEAGPTLGCQRDAIRTVRVSQVVPLSGFDDDLDRGEPPTHLVARLEVDLRAVACLARVEGEGLVLPPRAAALLAAEPGARLRVVSLR